MYQEQAHPLPPGINKLLWELPKAARETLRLADWRWRNQLKNAPAGDGHAVMTLPGFGGGDACMALLRNYLQKIGYQAEPWGLGTNVIRNKVQTLDQVLDFCQQKEGEIVERLERLCDQTGDKVSLIGWSMGGIYANSLAQTHPELVRQIITLGSPVGDPRGTSVWNIMKKLMRGNVPDSLQNVDAWVSRRDQQGERRVRTSIIYSEHDGAVSRESAIIENHELVENIHVPSSHVGFTHNPAVYWVIADRLSQQPDNWRSFCHASLPAFHRKHF
ncbi:MAG TPA: alpha/beta fold hydrolase [Pseudomonadales bacterium]